MEMEKKELSGREKDEASIKLLKRLREQLYSTDASNRRRAAYKLSWMQEDGLDILKATLFGNCPVPSKNAAAYGLRKMRGRMKKMALEDKLKELKLEVRGLERGEADREIRVAMVRGDVMAFADDFFEEIKGFG